MTKLKVRGHNITIINDYCIRVDWKHGNPPREPFVLMALITDYLVEEGFIEENSS